MNSWSSESWETQVIQPLIDVEKMDMIFLRTAIDINPVRFWKTLEGRVEEIARMSLDRGATKALLYVPDIYWTLNMSSNSDPERESLNLGEQAQDILSSLIGIAKTDSNGYLLNGDGKKILAQWTPVKLRKYALTDNSEVEQPDYIVCMHGRDFVIDGYQDRVLDYNPTEERLPNGTPVNSTPLRPFADLQRQLQTIKAGSWLQLGARISDLFLRRGWYLKDYALFGQADQNMSSLYLLTSEQFGHISLPKVDPLPVPFDFEAVLPQYLDGFYKTNDKILTFSPYVSAFTDSPYDGIHFDSDLLYTK